jgi:hypothetical protein
VLGLRVGLSDIAALGAQTAILVVVAMAATVASGFVFARWNGRTRDSVRWSASARRCAVLRPRLIGLGWRHIATVLGTTAVIFAVVTGGLVLMRYV